MKLSYIPLIILLIIGCKNNLISYNPLKPNINLKTKTILSNGFKLRWGCDGGLNTYSLNKGTYELFFHEDCLNPGKIIGETYNFKLTFENYREEINSIINSYGGEIIEIEKIENFTIQHLNVRYIDSNFYNYSINNCNINCSSINGDLILTIENWYRKKL